MVAVAQLVEQRLVEPWVESSSLSSHPKKVMKSVNIKKKIQIGLIGSYSDLKFSRQTETAAYEIGKIVAESGAVLMVGGEKDGGLTKAAAKGASDFGGIVVGIMPKKEKACEYLDTVIQTGGLVGFREYILSISCDVIIAINGGGGTLNEVAVAYQNNIPVVMLKKSGGWSQTLAGKYLDQRKRYKFIGANGPKQAVKRAMDLAKERREETDK